MIDPEGESYAHEVGYGHTSIMLKPPLYQQSTVVTVHSVLRMIHQISIYPLDYTCKDFRRQCVSEATALFLSQCSSITHLRKMREVVAVTATTQGSCKEQEVFPQDVVLTSHLERESPLTSLRYRC